MAVVQPIAQSVPAFDAKNDNVFKFVSNGGNQVIANRLVIRNNDTNEEVYNQKIESYRFEHTVPASTLTNGVYYNFYFRTYDILDNESPMSNVIPFMCYDTPTIKITNIPENGIIESSVFTLNISYNQGQGELIDFAKVLLYDQLGNEIFESENIYSTFAPPLTLEYTLNGLEDNTTYGVSVKVITVNKTVINSEIENFTTRYFTPSLSTLLELENNCEDGYIQIKNNFYIVDSESNPPNIGTNPKYLKDGKLYLDDDGTYITWNQGFTIEDNFTARIHMESVEIKDVVIFGIGNEKIIVNFTEDYPYMSDSKKYCAELKCYDGLNEYYYIYSNFVDKLDKIFLWVRRINNIFEIIIEDLNKTIINWNESTGINWEESTGVYWQ